MYYTRCRCCHTERGSFVFDIACSSVQHSLQHQAKIEYKHSLTFRVRSCVVIATKPAHRLQIRPTVHNQRVPSTIPPTYIRDCSVVRECCEGQTDRQSWLRTATRFIRPISRTKEYCSFINYALNHYQLPPCNNYIGLNLLFALQVYCACSLLVLKLFLVLSSYSVFKPQECQSVSVIDISPQLRLTQHAMRF